MLYQTCGCSDNNVQKNRYADMITKTAMVKNNMGIHVRPTGVIIDAMHDSPAEIRVTAKGIESNLRDHISILAMGLCKGDTVEITVSGENEEATADQIVELFEREFDFPPRT